MTLIRRARETKSLAADRIQAIGIDLECKFAKDAKLPEGEFRGYGAVFGNVDSHGDVIEPGAFKASLAKRAAEGRSLPMHAMHGGGLFGGGDGLPIGVWKEVAEDDKGLRVHGKVSGATTTDQGRLNWERVQDRAFGGLSIGYRPVDFAKGTEKGVKRHLKSIDLLEISLVDSPSNALAIVDEMKRFMKGKDDQPRDERGRWTSGANYSTADRVAHDKAINDGFTGLNHAHSLLRVGLNSVDDHLNANNGLIDKEFIQEQASGLKSDAKMAEEARTKANAIRSKYGDEQIPRSATVDKARAVSTHLQLALSHIDQAKNQNSFSAAQTIIQAVDQRLNLNKTLRTQVVCAIGDLFGLGPNETGRMIFHPGLDDWKSVVDRASFEAKMCEAFGVSGEAAHDMADLVFAERASGAAKRRPDLGFLDDFTLAS